MRPQQILALKLCRLPAVGETPGLILLTVDVSDGVDRPRQVGVLTDVALRGRLGHYDLHSANELAAIRKALQPESGQITIHETWAGPGSCLRFWHDFVGSQIRPVEWICEGCSALNRLDVGASVGEPAPSVSRDVRPPERVRRQRRRRRDPLDPSALA